MNKKNYLNLREDVLLKVIRGLINNIHNGSVSFIKQDSVIIQINTREIYPSAYK